MRPLRDPREGFRQKYHVEEESGRRQEQQAKAHVEECVLRTELVDGVRGVFAVTYDFAPVERKQVDYVGDVEEKQQTRHQQTEQGDEHHEADSTGQGQHEQPYFHRP